MEVIKPYVAMKYYEAKTAEEREAVLNDPNRVLTLKRDGASYQLAKDKNGVVHLWSGNIAKKDGLPIDKIDRVPHIKDFAENNLPINTILLGEICTCYDTVQDKICSHSASKRVTSIMNSLPKKAIERQIANNSPMEYYLFDVLVYNGTPYYELPFIIRHNLIENFYKEFSDESTSWLSVSPIIGENKAQVLSEWFAAGEEGAVVMDLQSPHLVRELGETGFRRKYGIKIKTLSTYDVFITRVIMPDKEYNGKYAEDYIYRDENNNPVNRLYYLNYISALEIACYNLSGDLIVLGTVSSGLDDTERKEIALHPEDYIGRVIEVRGMSFDKEHLSIRHPVFLNFRDDKEKSQCTIDNIL